MATSYITSGNGETISTTDGGVTWTADSRPPVTTYIQAVACSSALNCIAVGINSSYLGAVLSSNNGGATWTNETIASNIGTLDSISCAAASECTAVGIDSAGNGLSISTSDGGATWVTDTTPPGLGNIPAVSCVSSTDCMSLGEGGYFWDVLSTYLSTGTPNVPTAVNASAQGSDAALSWGPPVSDGGSSVTGYVINESINGVAQTPVTVSYLTFSYQFTGYSPGTKVVFSVSSINSQGTGSASQTVGVSFPFSSGTYVPISPVRVCDTRTGATDPATYAGDTLVTGNESISIPISGVAGDNVQSNATAIVANITAVNPSMNGYLTVYPQGYPKPATSSLNFVANEYAIANMVVIPLGAGGGITITNFMGNVDVLVDIQGYMAPQSPGNTSGLFNPVSPFRVVDTRVGATDPATYQGQTFSPGQARTFLMAGATGGTSIIPASGVGAVVINVTVTNTSSDGFVSVSPNPITSAPTFSDINFMANESIPNRVIVPLNANGTISVYVNKSADIIINVSGWFTSATTGATGDRYFPVVPTRIADTRTNSGYQDANQHLVGNVGPGLGPFDQVEGANINNDGVPSNAGALLLNVTVTNTTTYGFLTLWPSSTNAPNSSDLNWTPAETIPNAVVVPVSSSGYVSVAANSACDFVVDASGFFAP